MYSFPIDAPFRTIHIDIYTVGKTESFDGNVALFIVVDHMTSFAVIEPVKETNSKTFAKALMKILLTHGLCHTIIIDADSKFRATFAEVADLLHLNKYELAKGNHKAMLVERFNRYLNKVTKIFKNERATNRTYIEGALLAAYAWNSSPISGTDISKSLLVMSREFNFPVDFATDRTFSTRNDPEIIHEYTRDLVTVLQESREIYKILIEEQRAMHRELKNAEVSNAIKFKVGDLVLARKQVQSNKAKGRVDKTEYVSTGPWIITADYGNGSYLLQHSQNPEKQEKRLASMLELCPSYFIPQKPLIGSDHAYSEIHKEIRHTRYKSAGISEEPAKMAPLQLNDTPELQVLANQMSVTLPPFPSLSDLNIQYSSGMEELYEQNEETEGSFSNSQALPRNSQKTNVEPTQLQTELTILVPRIISSTDKLFFIAHSYSGQQRKEWKLVQLDFSETMRLNPQSITNGRFLVNFLIAHPHDSSYTLTQQRYWPHYHNISIPMDEHSSKIKFIRPGPEASEFATKNNLTPVRFWVQLNDPSVLIHGPFEFAVSNGRKTIDKIAAKDWEVLIANAKKYDDFAPSLSTKSMVSFSLFSPFFETICKNDA